MDFVADMRAFNRAYTSAVGLVAGRLPGSKLTLSEGRILFELAQRPGVAAATIARELGLDRAQISRTLLRFEERGWLKRVASPDHGKRVAVHLTECGKEAADALGRATQADLANRFGHLPIANQERVSRAFATIKDALAINPDESGFAIRALATGDLGAVIAQQAIGYNRQFGWNLQYEGLVAEILGEFVRDFDASKDDAWIADRGGDVAGSVFLVRGNAPGVARLRLLYVEPWARGAGLGEELVRRCIERAKALGYRELTLWTNSVLVAARTLYERAGFELVDEQPHHSFGHDLIGQTWRLVLQTRRPPREGS